MPELKRSPGRGKYDRGLSRAERQLEQKLALIEATGQIIAAHGFAGASVAAICEAAGMSRRTFYEHFGGLKDAMHELHDHAANYAFAHVAERFEGVADPFARLRAGVTAFLELISEHGDMARVVFREVRAAGPQYEVRRERELERYAALILDGAEEAHAAGLLSRPPDEITVYALVAAMEAVAMRYATRGEAKRAREAESKLLVLVFAALGARESPIESYGSVKAPS